MELLMYNQLLTIQLSQYLIQMEMLSHGHQLVKKDLRVQENLLRMQHKLLQTLLHPKH
jgi:hypothetical protein